MGVRLAAGVLGLTAGAVGGCAGVTHPMVSAGQDARDRAQHASEQAEDALPGVNSAVMMPLRDFNLMRDHIPPILVRAYARPYDTAGLDSCAAVQSQVEALDFALGPDVDIPRAASPEESMMERGRGLAGRAALDAVQHATTGGIPVRSWVRRLSGAERAETEAKAVALSGSVRRGFLKAFGAQMHCQWPAAPLDERQIAAVAAAQAKAANAAQPVTTLAQSSLSTPATARP